MTTVSRHVRDPDDGPDYGADLDGYGSARDVVDSSVYPYRDEIVVELTIEDDENTLVVKSYRFERTDDGTVEPAFPVDPADDPVVSAALEREGYETPEPSGD